MPSFCDASTEKFELTKNDPLTRGRSETEKSLRSTWLGLVDVFQENLRDFLTGFGNDIPILTSKEQRNCRTGTIQT